MKIARVRLATNISRILFVALAVPISACATASAPNEGVVIDTSTGKPIPEAFVVAQWTYRHSTIHTVRTSCAYLQVVQADAMGRFRIPEAPASMIGDIKRSITGYKAGFGWDYSKPEQEGRVAMRPFVGTPKERLDGFRYYSSLLSCAPQSDITQRLLPLYRALDEEIATLPKSDVGSMQSRSFESYLRGFEKDAKTAQDFELKKGKD